MTAADVIRSLVKEIILTPENGELQVDVRGNLVGILAISLESKRPTGGPGRSQVELVAGALRHSHTVKLVAADRSGLSRPVA